MLSVTLSVFVSAIIGAPFIVPMLPILLLPEAIHLTRYAYRERKKYQSGPLDHSQGSAENLQLAA